MDTITLRTFIALAQIKTLPAHQSSSLLPNRLLRTESVTWNVS